MAVTVARLQQQSDKDIKAKSSRNYKRLQWAKDLLNIDQLHTKMSKEYNDVVNELIPDSKLHVIRTEVDMSNSLDKQKTPANSIKDKIMQRSANKSKVADNKNTNTAPKHHT